MWSRNISKTDCHRSGNGLRIWTILPQVKLQPQCIDCSTAIFLMSNLLAAVFLNIYKIDFGPGYRVYFGQDKNVLIILLTGGIKKSQSKDIEKAKMYWQEYSYSKKQGG